MARIDPDLKRQLEARGLTRLVGELEGTAKKASVVRQFFPALGEKVTGVAQKAKEFLPIGKIGAGIGGALASPEIKQQQEETTQRGLELQDVLIEQIRKAQGDPEKTRRLLQISKQIGGTDIIGQVPELQITTREILGDAFGLASLAVLGFKPSTLGVEGITGRLATQQVRALSQVSKQLQTLSNAERVRKFGKLGTLVNKVIPIVKEAGIGAGFFGGLSAVEGRPVKEVAQQAGFGALIGGGVVAGTQVGALVVGKTAQFLKPKITKVGQRIITELERVSAPAPKISRIQKAGTEVEKVLAVIPSRFKTLKQKTAQRALTDIERIKKIPATLFNRFSSIERAQLNLEQLKGSPLTESEKIGRNARLTASTGAGRAELAIGDFLQSFRQFDDIRDETTAYLLKLDFLDRARLGQKIASGETLAQVTASLSALERELGDKLPRIRQAQQVYNNFNKSLLQERVEAGLISQDLMDKLLISHKNYLPHNVVARVDEEIANAFNVSDSLNVSKNDIKKAVGSTRELEDPISATAQRTQVAFQLIERNKTLKGLVEAQEKFDFVEGMRPVVTAEQVTRRKEIINQVNLIKESGKFFDLPEDLKGLVLETINKNLDETLGVFKNPIIDQLDEISKILGTKFEVGGIGGRGGGVLGFFQRRSQEGKFFYNPKIKLNPKIGGVNRMTLAHEIGHNINDLIEGSTNNLFRKIRQNIDSPKFTELRKELKNLSFTIRPLVGERGGARQLRTSVEIGSTPVIPKNVPKSFLRYRNSSPELFADYMSVFLTDKKLARKSAPQFTEFFEGILKTNTNVDEALSGLQTIIKDVPEKQLSGLTDIVDLDDLASAIKGTKIDFNTADQQVLDNVRRFLGEELKLLRPEQIELGEKTINLFRDGIKETWVVPNDIELAVKNLEASKLNGLLRVLTIPNRILKAGATRLNLSFAVPNLFRDRQTALLTADSFIDSLARKTEASPTTINLSKKELKRLWTESGGAGSSIFREDGFGIRGVQKPPEKIVKQLEKRGLIKVLDTLNPVKIIEAVNESIETSTRLDTFEKALRRGLSPRDASIVARDATIDFAKMGTFMRNLNQLVPFLNARVQGFANIPRALANNPETFARLQLWTAVYPTVALHQHNRQFESFDNVSQWFKDSKWVIMTGEVDGFDSRGNPVKIPKFITVPKGEGQQLVSNPIQFFLERADKRDFRTVNQMLIDTLGSASPVSFQSFGSSNAILTGVSQLGAVPTIATGLATGIKPFTGTPVIPRGREEARTELQFARTTPESVKRMANLIGVAPAKLEFVFDSFGGLPQDILDGLDIAGSLAKGEGLNLKTLEDSPFGQATKIPVLRTFFRETTGFGAPAQQKQAEIKTEVVEEVTSEKLIIKDQAEQLILDLNKLPDEATKTKFIRDKQATGELSQEVIEKAQDIKKRGARVLELTISDPVAVRARVIKRFIDDSLEAGTDPKEIEETLILLQTKKILTKSTKKAIEVLQGQ